MVRRHALVRSRFAGPAGGAYGVYVLAMAACVAEKPSG